MKFLITEYFFKSIPIEKKDKVLSKLYYFYNTIKENKTLLSDIPKGFWIKKIKGVSSLFEFRVDSGDRIFFVFNPFFKEREENILFLLYSSHENAVKKAKRKELIDSNIDDFTLIEEEENSEILKKVYSNRNNAITYEILSDDIFFKNNFDKKYRYYYLNDEQFLCLKQLPPYFIAGSAGSGKSTITLRKLLNLEENNFLYNTKKILYLTANRYLKKNTFEQYKEFRDKKKPTLASFYTLKEFFSEILNISPEKIIGFDEFKSFFLLSYPNKKKLDFSIEEIYSEINGIIKGLMISKVADNWNRDISKSCILLNDYLSLSLKYSVLDSKMRLFIYSVCENYNEWLAKNSFYDLNDLARLSLLYKSNFDFNLIDEIKDLTEIKIFSLISSVENKENVLLAGDIHQMINSTFFNFSRIKNLFYSKYNKNIDVHILSKNYRSYKKIVELANFFSNLRASYIGNLGIDDYKEIPIHDNGDIVLSNVNYTLIEKAQNDVSFAIIVPDSSVKISLLEKLNNKHRIFTIQEIKGLEYENIITYNLSSAYQAQWNKIFSNEVKHDQRYRKYFNIFYVGITRAQKKLIIMEEYISENAILEALHDFLVLDNNIITTINEQKNTEKEKENWLKEGIKLFEMEKIDEAQYAFEKADEPTWILEREIENDINKLLFKNAIKKIESKDLKGKQNIYKKLLIDVAIENSLFIDAIESNKIFGISYKEKEIKEGIKISAEKNLFSDKELKKIITFFKEKKDSLFIGDLLIKLKRYNDALAVFQTQNNSRGIRAALSGILFDKFSTTENYDKKIADLESILIGKNINAFDKKDRLTALHRALILKEDPVLFKMVLALGGNIKTHVKGKNLLFLYYIDNMKLSKDKLSDFIDIFIEYNFDYNNLSYIPIFYQNPIAFKLLVKKNQIDQELFFNTLNSLTNDLMKLELNDILRRKLELLKNILKNYRRRKI